MHFQMLLFCIFIQLKSVYFLDADCFTRCFVTNINIEIKMFIIPAINMTNPKRLNMKSMIGIL